MAMGLQVTWFTDPACPWASSANPALSVLRWRYADGLRWQLVTIGLVEDAARFEAMGYTPARAAQGQLTFRRRYGMPFGFAVRERAAATGRACRAIVATRLRSPEHEYAAHRALAFAWFNTSLVLDRDEDIAAALGAVPGLDVAAVVGAIDDEATEAGYQADRELTRNAAGGATEFQGKARQSDGPVRYSAPSLVFRNDAGVRLEAGGFQSIEAYDVLIANLDTTLQREPAPESPLDALRRFPGGLVTAEVAAIMAGHNEPPDPGATEAALFALVGEGSVQRAALGDDALWQPAGATPFAFAA